jgi:nucleoside-diphosphate-sugar epimerase
MKTVYLYGGNGYIGKNLQAYFADKDVTWCVIGDQAVRYFNPDPDAYLIHLACPRKTIKDNTLGGLSAAYCKFTTRFTEAVLRGLELQKALQIPSANCLYFSSQSIWDIQSGVYSQFKKAATEVYVKAKWKIAYPGTVFGFIKGAPMRMDTVINKLIKKMANNEDITVTMARRRFNSIKDICLMVHCFIASGVVTMSSNTYCLADLFEENAKKIKCDVHGTQLEGTHLEATKYDIEYLKNLIFSYCFKYKTWKVEEV